MIQALEGRGFVLRRRGAPETGVPQERGFGWLAVKIWEVTHGKMMENQQFPMGKWKNQQFFCGKMIYKCFSTSMLQAGTHWVI
jgi:hypothetical protein